ncbi:MAG: chemotaxis protein CheW [Aphanocapsa sp. GSE-SYN-MK-11-07L]|nr:chemotaxis protein CheW [Aphanocapsa sp. GSE-SYN-MK-11-07L]
MGSVGSQASDQFSLFDPFDLPDQVSKPQPGEMQFLSFPLGSDTLAMLSVDQLTEVLTLSIGQVVPIPDMAAYVLGAYNWRGKILWVLDLAQLLGLEPLHQQMGNAASYKVLVSQPDRKAAAYLGLAVMNVDDMHWCNPSDIESAPTVAATSSVSPFLRGFTLSRKGEMLLAIDAAAIFDRMLSSN